MLSKTDPQTHITLANGYQYRARPVTGYGYDLLGRLTALTDANGNLSRQSFVGTGEQLAAQWAGDNGHKTTDYDIFGDARKLTDELGHVTQQETDALDHVTKVTRTGVTRSINHSIT